MRIKGFDKNLCCRGMQYEVGKKYTTNAKDLTSYDLCSNKVLHYCNNLQEVNYYYYCNNDNRYCEIEVLGEEVTDGSKYGSNHIKIVREIVGEELNALKGYINGNSGLFNSGKWNSGSNNSGNWNSGRFNIGWHNCGSYNIGNWNSGCYNSGGCNSGDKNNGGYNSGYCNNGSYNSGDSNTGYYNSGDSNSGYYNSGDSNSGNHNSGLFNSCDRSNGAFCTENIEKINLFNKPSGMTFSEFVDSKYYKAIKSSPFILTEWIKYTDEEKKESEQKALYEGYLKVYTYQEACKNWWNNMTEENKEIIKSTPNFDGEVFEHITGIKV